MSRNTINVLIYHCQRLLELVYFFAGFLLGLLLDPEDEGSMVS
jgi:hypothetical protein